MNKAYPLILGITAASGIIYGLRALEFLLKRGYSVELILSSKSYYIFQSELGIAISHNKEVIASQILNYLEIEQANLTVWLDDELWASPSSGSYLTQGMIIAPASMASIGAIAGGYSENLISRAADVCIKEGRNLVIVPRETPFSQIHLENMLKLSKAGVKIVPPIVGFYSPVKTLEDAIDFIVGKILDSCQVTNNLYERWK